MKIFAKNAARPWGFTLVELLTVIAIIAVLATLTSASLVNAQKKGRKAVSISNLRQIAVAFNFYIDDHQRRPASFRQMVDSKYITERVLLCPEDRIIGNWAGILELEDSARASNDVTTDPANGGVNLPGTGAPPSAEDLSPVPDVPHSYFQSFDYADRIWQSIDRSAMGGIAACQLHGMGRQSKDVRPSLDAYQGLVLRALKDGSVVSRQVFWGNNDFSSSITPGDGPSTLVGSSQLPFFLDPTE